MNEWIVNASEYLQSHWLDWLTSLVSALVILLVTWLISLASSRATKRALSRRRGAKSFAPMTATLVRLTVFVTGSVVAADQIGIDITAVIASAGILGLAVGFGAQTLVKDLISGFFLVVEDVVEENDWVDIGGKFGRIEAVGLRMTKLRAFDGTLWHIPNGEVSLVGNRTREWARAIATVDIAYEADLRRALEVLQKVGDEFAAEHEEIIWPEEPPIAQGVLSLDESSVALRLVAKIKHDSEGRVWALERELMKRIKLRFDEEKVEIPFPRRVVYTRSEAA